MMKKISKPIPLKNIADITGKKSDKGLVYTYLNFNFNLHRLGNNDKGLPMYRLTPLNFDNKLLKSVSQKNSKIKDSSTIQLNNVKKDLISIFDSIIEVKIKKEMARLAYEKAVKDGTYVEKEEPKKEIVEQKKSTTYSKFKNKDKSKDFKKNFSKSSDKVKDNDKSKSFKKSDSNSSDRFKKTTKSKDFRKSSSNNSSKFKRSSKPTSRNKSR